jgi:hypothetical protein
VTTSVCVGGAVGRGDGMVTDEEPTSAQAGSLLSPLVGSLVPVLSIQEGDVDRRSSI